MRRWRVGTFSMGILLIAVGIILLAGEIGGLDGAGLIVRWWPVILIILGLEILIFIAFSRDEQAKIKFDGLSIFLIIFIVLVSTCIYGAQSFIKSEFSRGVFGQFGFYKNETVLSKNFEVAAGPVKKIQVANSNGTIEVVQYDGEKIKIDASIFIRNNDEEQAKQAAENLIELSEGETLSINTKNQDILENPHNYQVTVNYAIKVPKSVILEVNSGPECPGD